MGKIKNLIIGSILLATTYIPSLFGQDSSKAFNDYKDFGQIDSTVYVNSSEEIKVPRIKGAEKLYGGLKSLPEFYFPTNFSAIPTMHHSREGIGSEIELLGQIHPNKIDIPTFNGVYSSGSKIGDTSTKIIPGGFSSLNEATSVIKRETPLKIEDEVRYSISSNFVRRQVSLEGEVTNGMNSRLILANTAAIKVVEGLEVFPTNLSLINTNKFSGEIDFMTYFRLLGEKGELNRENRSSGIKNLNQEKYIILFASTMKKDNARLGFTYQKMGTDLMIKEEIEENFKGSTEFKRTTLNIDSEFFGYEKLKFKIKTEISINNLKNKTTYYESKKDYTRGGLEVNILFSDQFLTEGSINTTLGNRTSFSLSETANLRFDKTNLEVLVGWRKYFNPLETNMASAENLTSAIFLGGELATQLYASAKFRPNSQIIKEIFIEGYKKQIKDIGGENMKTSEVEGFSVRIGNDHLGIKYLHGNGERNGEQLDGAVGNFFQFDGNVNLFGINCFSSITWKDFYHEIVYGTGKYGKRDPIAGKRLKRDNVLTTVPSTWIFNMGFSKEFEFFGNSLEVLLNFINFSNKELIIRSYYTGEEVKHLEGTPFFNLGFNYTINP